MRYFSFLVVMFFLSCKNSDKQAGKINKSLILSAFGEKLYKSNCVNCHKINSDFTGPSLKGAYNRWENKNNLFDFVRNPPDIIKKDLYARNLAAHWSPIIMSSYPLLKNEDIKAVLDYCDNSIGD